MNLYLIRHGDSETDKPDEERSLTQIGRESVAKIAKSITKRAEPPAIILSSPLKRAIETAEFFAKGWKLKIQTVDWLRSEAQPSVVIEEMRKMGAESFALVGHLPNLGLLLGTLVWGLPPKEIVLPRAGVAYLTMSSPEPGAANLRWLVTTDLLRNL